MAKKTTGGKKTTKKAPAAKKLNSVQLKKLQGGMGVLSADAVCDCISGKETC